MKTNKPQWLIDAENEIQNFEESKYGKLNQKEFNLAKQRSDRSEKGRLGIKEWQKTEDFILMQKQLFNRAIEKNPQMRSKGGKKRAESFDFNHQSYAASCRSKESLKKAGLIGGKKSGEISAQKSLKNKKNMYDIIPFTEFTFEDIIDLNIENKLNVKTTTIKLWLSDTNFYIKIGKRDSSKPGPRLNIYKKVK